MAVLPAAFVVQRAGAQTGSAPSIRIGAAGTDSFAEGYYALETGFFKRAGLNVEIVPLTTGAQIAAAVAGGSIDIGISNTVQLANAIAHSAPFVIVAGAGLSDAAPALVVANSSPIRSAKDLEGKTVAVEALKDLTQVAPSAWIDQNGADLRKVRFVEVHFAEVSAALGRGTIDAGMLAEPFLSEASGKTVRLLANVCNSIASSFLVSAWFSTRDYLSRNADIVKRFVIAVTNAARWANTYRDQSAAILAAHSKIDLATIKGMPRCSFTASVAPRYIQPLLTQLYKYHAIDKPLGMADVVAIREEDGQ